MLVPMNCPLYDEYTEVRGSVALPPSDLNSISTTGQSCGEFGIHARLPILGFSESMIWLDFPRMGPIHFLESGIRGFSGGSASKLAKDSQGAL